MPQVFPDFDLPEVKRFYMQGVVLKQPCPSCEKELTWDAGDDYLMYPCNGGEYTIHFHCKKCNEDFEIIYQFDFTVTATAKK